MCLANLAAMSQVCKGYIMLVERSSIILLIKDADLKDQVDNSKFFDSSGSLRRNKETSLRRAWSDRKFSHVWPQ